MEGFQTLKGSWPWPWPSIRPYGIPSCITHRPLPIYQIIQIEETFCGRTDARTDIFPSILLGRLFGSWPNSGLYKFTFYLLTYYACINCILRKHSRSGGWPPANRNAPSFVIAQQSTDVICSTVHIDICLHAVFPGWVPTSVLTLGLRSPVAEKMKVGIKQTRVARWWNEHNPTLIKPSLAKVGALCNDALILFVCLSVTGSS